MAQPTPAAPEIDTQPATQEQRDTENFLEPAPSRKSWRYPLSREELLARSRDYGFNPDRAFFPVNSLRILYLLLSDALTDSNSQARAAITELVPRVDALTIAGQRDGSTSRSVGKALDDIYEVIDTPMLRQFLVDFIHSGLPRQRELIAEINQELQSGPANSSHLARLLEARSIDSYALSAVLFEVAKKYLDPDLNDLPSDDILLSLLHLHINRATQLNDLVDAIVHANEDLESSQLTPFQLIHQIAPHPQQAKTLTHNHMQRLIIPNDNSTTETFYQALKEVIVI